MMNIEDFIKDNRTAFDSEEPLKGHTERFMQRLPQQKSRTFVYMRVVGVAATLLLVTLSGLYVYDNLIRETHSYLPTLADAGAEYAETEAYFISTISNQRQVINDLSGDDLLAERKQFDQEMQIMDSLFVQLQKDLKTNPDDPRVINAMINHYQIRIRVMEKIVNRLKETQNVKPIKNQNDEKIYV